MAPRLTEQQKREKALRVAISRAKEERGIKNDGELAAAIGVPRSTFSKHKQASFQKMGFYDVAKMCRFLQVTPKEWCSIAGIPFETKGA